MLVILTDLIGEKAGLVEDDEDYRKLSNIIGLVLITILVGTGVWLAHAIADITVRTG